MSVYTVSNLTWCVAYIRTDALTNSSSATLGLCTKPQLSPLWVILLKINRGNITRSLVSSLWIRNKNKIYYSCPENCLSLMFPLLFIGLCISCKSLHDRQSNLKVGQFSMGQAYSQTVSDKNKSINQSTPPDSLSLCVSFSLWSAITLLVQCCLIDIRCTSPLANALNSLQPQWEEACQYEAGALLLVLESNFF